MNLSATFRSFVLGLTLNGLACRNSGQQTSQEPPALPAAAPSVNDPSVDGRVVGFGDSVVFSHFLQIVDSRRSWPNTDLSRTLHQYDRNWYQGGFQPSLTASETDALLQTARNLYQSMPQTDLKRERVVRRTILELEAAIRSPGGGLSLIRSYEDAEAPAGLVETPAVSSVFAGITDIVNGQGRLLEFHAATNSPTVVVFADAHMREPQNAIGTMVRRLHERGVITLFSESTPYDRDREIEVSSEIDVGSQRYYYGMRSEEALRGWPEPRAAQALEFYFGGALKVYGSEDPTLYARFASVADATNLRVYIRGLHGRSRAMVDNILSQMSRDNVRRSAFIMGGAHADSVLARLRERGASYLLIVPNGIHPRMLADYRSYFREE